MVDTEYAIGLLSKEGFTISQNPEEAEIIAINTCAFIQPATEESLDTIMEFIPYKQKNCRLLVVTGCLVERYKESLASLIPEVDLWIGTGAYSRLPRLILTALREKKSGAKSLGQVCLDRPGWLAPLGVHRPLSTGGHMAYVKIAEGCDNFCHYCIIPQIRGRYRSRRPEEIRAEVRELIARGVKEIILVAQDTTNYGVDLEGRSLLPSLLSELDSLKGEFWLRMLYTYPSRISRELLGVMRDSVHICPYLDLPLQHSEDRVLAAMGRRTTRKEILQTLDLIRENLPGAALRTTFILGYPGETEEEFGKLREFLQMVRFDWVGVFPFYQEEGAKAAKMKPQVPQAIREERAAELSTVQQEISREKNQALIGSRLTVMVEKRSESSIWTGRSYREAPEIDGVIELKAPKNSSWSPGDFLVAEVVQAEAYKVVAAVASDE